MDLCLIYLDTFDNPRYESSSLKKPQKAIFIVLSIPVNAQEEVMETLLYIQSQEQFH